MGTDITVISDLEVSPRVRPGPKTCFWCRNEISYTIHPMYWYCFECGRYTGEEIQGVSREESHACTLVGSPYQGTVTIELKCSQSYCTKESSLLTSKQYEEYLKEKEERDYVSSLDFALYLDGKDEEFNKRKRKLDIAKQPTMKISDPDFQESFAQYRKFLEKKRDSRDRNRDKRLEKRANR